MYPESKCNPQNQHVQPAGTCQCPPGSWKSWLKIIAVDSWSRGSTKLSHFLICVKFQCRLVPLPGFFSSSLCFLLLLSTLLGYQQIFISHPSSICTAGKGRSHQQRYSGSAAQVLSMEVGGLGSNRVSMQDTIQFEMKWAFKTTWLMISARIRLAYFNHM